MKKLLSNSVLCLLVLFCTWGIYISLIGPLITWSKATSWQSVPTQIDRAEILHGSKGYRKLIIEYGYEWNGVAFRNDQISIYPNSLGRSRQSRNSLLAQYTDPQQPIVFVNPEAPQESMLQRHFDPVKYLGNIFMQIVNLYFCFGVFWVVRSLTVSTPDSGNSSDKVNEAFESSAWKFVAYLAGAFTLISVAIVAMIVSYVSEGDMAVLFFLIFPIVTLFLWVVVWYCWSNRFDEEQLHKSGKAKVAA